ncbi:MAG TPA: hypothetical protein VJ835_11480 [Fimbriimonadaceae bacterium]|nr:hypothetical protein [Fimbriimonadaceae bacterium]
MLFLATIVAVVALCYRSRTYAQQPTLASNGITPEPIREPVRTKGTVLDGIKALDKLFDENLLSVDEYIELRRRAKQGPGHA